MRRDMEDLYGSIKSVLTFFDLGWHEKDKVTVHIEGTSLVFTYDGRSITLPFK